MFTTFLNTDSVSAADMDDRQARTNITSREISERWFPVDVSFRFIPQGKSVAEVYCYNFSLCCNVSNKYVYLQVPFR